MDSVEKMMEPMVNLLRASVSNMNFIFSAVGYYTALYNFRYIGEEHMEKLNELTAKLLFFHTDVIKGQRVNFAVRIKYVETLETCMKEVYEL